VDKYASTRRLLMQERWRIVSSSAPIDNANTASGQEGWTAIGLMHLSRCISNIRCHATTLAVCPCVLISSGAAMGWAVGGQSPEGPPSAGAPSSRPKKFKNSFPVTVKIGTSGYQTSNRNSQLFMLYGRLVHVGETFNRFADFGL